MQLKGFQNGAKDYKLGQGFQIGAEITNRAKRNFKPGQGLQIGAEQVSLLVVVF